MDSETRIDSEARMDSEARILVSSKTSMADEKINISLKGLVPDSYVTLKMDVTTAQGYPFISFARFKADPTGCVDLSRDLSYGGTYTGIDQMGMFWSLEPESKIANKYPRYLYVPDVTKPMEFSLILYNIDITSMKHLNQLQLNGRLQKLELDSCEFERLYVHPDVKIETITDEKDGITGTLYIPPGEGPHPGVILLFPGVFEFKASLLASRGFAVLALVFKGPIHHFLESKENIPRCDLNYYKNAIDFMVGHPNIIPSGVGLISNSFSAQLALMMATQLSHVSCVVCINGEIHNMGIKYLLDDKVIDGTDYGFKRRFQECVTGRGIIDMSVLFPKIPLTELLKQKGLIPFYNKKEIAFMYIAGLDDKCVHAGYNADMFKILLDDANHPNYEVYKYVGAGHLIDLPYSALATISKLQRTPIKWGGSIVPHAIAQEHSWKKQVSFLRRNIVASPKQSSVNNRTPVNGWFMRSLSFARKTFKMF